MKRWRRPLILIALLLLVGAVVNVGVAWTLCWAGYSGTVRGAEGMKTLPAWHIPLRSFAETSPDAEVWRGQWRSRGWTVSFESGEVMASETVAFGWPLRTLALSAFANIETGEEREVAALVLRPQRQLAGAGALPLRPVVAGFAINTLFYAVVVGAILALPLSASPIRRRLRARRGRCPKCGYDRTGLADSAAPCPECGAAR